MTKKAAIALAVAILAIVVWGFFIDSGSTRIVINGQEITGPLKGGVGLAGLIADLVALFCVAILLLFVFAGVGVFVVGGAMFVGLVWVALSLPYLLVVLVVLVVLVPLALVWVFIAIARKLDAKWLRGLAAECARAHVGRAYAIGSRLRPMKCHFSRQLMLDRYQRPP